MEAPDEEFQPPPKRCIHYYCASEHCCCTGPCKFLRVLTDGFDMSRGHLLGDRWQGQDFTQHVVQVRSPPQINLFYK